MFVTSGEMLAKASADGYAVGAFNAENAEMVDAIIKAAEEMRSPVIIQTTSGTLRYLSPAYFGGMVSYAAKCAGIPVALHLDHGSSYELAKQCLCESYTSIMFDGSTKTYDENVELTKQVCELSKEKGIPVEGELGVIGGKEDDAEAEQSRYTDPDQAADFAKRTGVSSLAIAVGTAHGFYASAPKLNLDLITKTHKLLSIPLVLHGASGLDDAVVSKAIGLGMAKVNFATELRDAYTKAVRSYLNENSDAYDTKQFGKAAMLAIKELVKHKIKVCGSEGKA